MKNSMMLLTGLALAFSAAPAMAGGFVRGEFGRANVDIDVTDLGSDSDNDTAFSARGGYFFNKNFAVEGFYSQFYDESVEIDDGIDTITVSGKLSGFGLGVVGKTNLGDDQVGFFLSGRAGIMRGEIEVSATGLGSASETSTKPYFGVGAGYDFSETMGMSLNFDQHKGSGEGLSVTARTLTLGLEVRF